MRLIFITFNNDVHRRNSKYKWRNEIYHNNVDIVGKSELLPLCLFSIRVLMFGLASTERNIYM
jgi:hypothetical protein